MIALMGLDEFMIRSLRLPLIVLAATALAQPAVSGGFAEGDAGSSLSLQAGGMAMVAPKYEGAKDYEVIGVPFIAPAGLGETGFVQFRGPEDLRFRLLQQYGFEAGPLAGWRFEREEDDARRLRGLGDIDGGVVVGGYVAYRAGAFLPFVSYHHQVSGDDTGGVMRFGIEAKAPIWSAVSVTATLGSSWADDDYMDAYFSISGAQSARSAAGLGVYDADAGIKDVYVGLSTDVPLTSDWTLKLSGRYARLVGDAADSPIVESEDQFYAGVGLTYRFSLSR